MTRKENVSGLHLVLFLFWSPLIIAPLVHVLVISLTAKQLILINNLLFYLL